MLTSILSLIAVGFLWGATNPFIRIGTKGIQNIDTGSSVLYVYTLQGASISIAVPIANSLSFAFTAIVGYLLGEKIPGKNVITGTVLVTIGTSMIIYDKLKEQTSKVDIYSR